MDNIQTMGIVNAMRTGDARVDIIIAMLIPFVIRLLFDFAKKFEHVFTARFWMSLWEKWNNLTEDEYERCLSYSQNRSECDNKSQLLIKAIQLYIHKVVQVEFQKANVELQPPANDNDYDYDDDSDEEVETYADRLKNMKVLRKPRDDDCVDIGKYGNPPAQVYMTYSKVEREDQNQKLLDVIFKMHFSSRDGKAIDAFIDTAYEWYVEELKKAEKKNYRYFYELRIGGSKIDGGDDEYSRYQLSDEKTFDSLFFPEKENLLKLLKHFMNRSGKYAIKGYPHKLGILLHGPPGTGKTSLIKALAQYTGRSIININLAGIKTNKHLMKVFFDRRRSIENEYVEDDVGFKEAIFVMEDVDAASNIVKRRDGKKTVDMVQTEQVDIQSMSMWHMILNSESDDCKKLVETLMEKSDRLKEEAQKPELVRGIVHRMKSLPGLTVVADSVDDPSLKRIGEEALTEAEMILENSKTVSSFLAFHARKIKSLLYSGADISDALIDDLLETEVSTVAGSSDPSLSKDVSWTRGPSSQSPVFFGGPPVGSLGVVGGPEGMGDGTMGLGALSGNARGFVGLGNLDDGPLDSKKQSFIGGQTFTSLLANSDALNLSGLLNCLDGVVDSPGRLVILTSNHPEVLDPALVRPVS